MDKLYTTDEIAGLCLIDKGVISYWLKKGWIPWAHRTQAQRTDGRYRFYWTKEQAEEIIKFSDARYGTKRE